MIRGAIENVSRNRVYGWVWSPAAPVAGRRVLAFLDEACIGAGEVGDFRPDLKDAGLGDGMAGFNFDLTYPNPADAPRVVVRLEGSDAVLIQRRSRVMPPGAVASGSAPGRQGRQPQSLSSLQWMRARGWLSQSDFDFLRFFRQIGVYDRSLVVPQERPDRGEPTRLDPSETARQLLLLHRMDEAEVKQETLAAPRDWRRLAEQQELATGPGAVVALWSRGRGRLPVIEGSHLQAGIVAADAEPPPGMDYALGPDRLLFLDARCALGPGAAFPEGGVEAYFLAS
jgi:hypothetical protein